MNRLPFIGTIALALAYSAIASAQDSVRSKLSDRQLANKAVEKALKLEVAGADNSQRTAALDEALALDKNYAPAHWQRGEIFENGKWLAIEESARKHATHPYLRAYEKKRRETRDTEEGNWEIAAWCEPRSLGEQKFAHLSRVLELNPKNVRARLALGWKQTELGWIAPEQFLADLQFTAEEMMSMRRFGEKLNQILIDLHSTQDVTAKRAADWLKDLRDPSAVVAVEKVFSSKNEAMALVAIKILNQIRHPASTRSLTRHAIFHPSPKVRDQASDVLAKRDPQGWAPQLLGLLRNEVGLSVAPQYGACGELLGLRSVFAMEGRNSNEVVISDVNYDRYFVSQLAALKHVTGVVDRRAQNPNGDTTIVTVNDHYTVLSNVVANYYETKWQEMRIHLMAEIAVASAANSVAINNERTKELNERVYRAIDKLEPKKQIGASPDDYWKWWNRRKYWQAPSQKQTSTRYYSATIADRREDYFTVIHDTTTDISKISCMTESSEIWLQDGKKSVKDVRVGDLVFSVETSTGRIHLAPVIQVTKSKEPLETIALQVAGKRIECTRGHEFFVTGKGWEIASQLTTGDSLHGAAGPHLITSIQEGPTAFVYNLVVAKSRNYLVGDEKILSHDFSERAENYYLVPGLAPDIENPRP